ncbi:hypothetical protein [Cupriavidus basilensis]|uniref:Uncharacterized protein n=1 Tax=Cupriavidus basilensis TaxID=68895 RepID=A0A7M2GZL4_9BURK|nr:hypothetical protein [Cupriavidus basilensis]QOT78038.1 hypothetical protein F7R26_008490 [Cupriavidus basilensis]
MNSPLRTILSSGLTLAALMRTSTSRGAALASGMRELRIHGKQVAIQASLEQITFRRAWQAVAGGTPPASQWRFSGVSAISQPA